MREILDAKLKPVAAADQRYNLIREFLQHLILASLERRGYFKEAAFMGGTALRILYDLKRFSEDLDFSSIKKTKGRRRLLSLLDGVLNDLNDWGFSAEASPIKGVVVQNSFIKISDLVEPYRLGRDRRHKLSIKLEVDANPPDGYRLEHTPVQKDLLFVITHHDLPSLFAGKLHAIFFRKYLKGRDIYDLLWYCTKQVPVNATLLRNAAVQTEGAAYRRMSADNFKAKLIEKTKSLAMKDAKRDAAPFLIDPSETRLFATDLLVKAVGTIKFEE